MIISQTPLRISFFGGGTDYPGWYRKHGGQVLATTINKYCYLSVRHLPPFFEHRTKLVYSRVETVQRNSDLEHPAARAVLDHLKITRGVEIHHDADLPARSGMGTSSAFTVGLLHALYALQGKMSGKRQLALEGIHLEQDVLRENVGSQDQVSAAYGGLNHIAFHSTGDITVKPLILPASRMSDLESHLMLFYTGLKRTASQVAQSYVNELGKRERTLLKMGALVEQAVSVLSGGMPLHVIGEMLHEGWEAKRSLSPVISNRAIEGIYRDARASGAIGGKITGAGGGGFMFLFVKPENQAKVKKRLAKLIHVPFKLEQGGSQIILFEPEVDYAEAEKVRASQRVAKFRESKVAPARKIAGKK